MNFSDIEIVEVFKRFNPQKKMMGWSVHAYIPSLLMDLRGIYAKKYNQKWFVMIPKHVNYNEEEKRMISIPVITFTDLEMNDKFQNTIREKTIEFLENKILNDKKK